MCDNTSAIPIAKNLFFQKRMRHLERRHHFLRDRIEKGDIKMRYIERDSWLIFSPNSLMLLTLLLCRGGLVFSILMPWFEGELVFYLVYLHHFLFLLHFLHIHLS
jgi:hypothetical protein